jgi:magnesium transporter
MAQSVIESKGIGWHHIKGVNQKDLENLQENFKFHKLDYEDIKMDTPLSKMDTYKHYAFFVFHIPTLDKSSGLIRGEELYIFLSKDHLVTVTHKAIPEIEELQKKLKKNAKARASLMSKGPAFLMYQILFDVFRGSAEIVAFLTKEVSRLEKEIKFRHNKKITVDLGDVRRNVLFNRHLIDPQRNVLTNLASLERDFFPNEAHVYFDDLHDVLDTIWLTSDNLKLLIDGLFDMNEALLSHRTNEIVTLLTIISASLMVPTLVAGFYGMNVPWLPYFDNPNFVWALYYGGFIGMIIVVLAVMKIRK